MRGSRRNVVLAAAGASVGIAVVLVSAMITSGSPVFWEHYGCVQGQLIASEYNWTPQLFENAPYGGTVYAVAHFPGGSEGGPSQNGTASIIFWQTEYNLSAVNRVLETGAGPSHQCPAYEVSPGHNGLAPWQQSSGCLGCQLLGPGNESDAGIPTQFNISITGGPGLTSVIFHDAYVSDNDGNVSTCGRGSTEINVTSTHLDFQIPFSTARGTILINSTMYGIGESYFSGFEWNFTYSFPANFGTWQIDNLTIGPNAPGSGLAFSFLPCTD